MSPDSNGFQSSEIGMFPSDWDIKSIAAIAEKPQYGYTTSATDIDTGIKFLRITDISDSGVLWSNVPFAEIPKSKVKSFLLQPGDIVFARTGATTGKSYIISECPKAIFASYLIRLRVMAGTDSHFVYYYFNSNSYWAQISQSKSGAAQPGVNSTKLQNLLVPLPPLSEQRRIAALLNAIQDAIAAQEDVIAAARQFKRSLMQRLFTYGPGRAPAETKETEIGEIPAHWVVVNIADVVHDTQYGLNERADRTGTYPVLRMNNLVEGKVDASDLKYVELDDSELSRYRLNVGDILFNRTNSFELVGKTSLFDLSGIFTFASYLVRLVANRSRILPEYLNIVLNYEATQARMKYLATRGVSQSNISPTKLKTLAIPLPLISEQQEIASDLQAIDTKIAAEEDRKTALEALFKSMLHQLMTGQIRLLADEGLPV
ncbi:MAG: restriction endonuclease subunit S [Caldilinea sp.]|nr:restriction endonuclease subunit S [Caldilinea sp.]MCW5845142.1 restriction endonuclease subunit S [Caldilinea sp.]